MAYPATKEEEMEAVGRVFWSIGQGWIDISGYCGCDEDSFVLEFIEDAITKHYKDVFGVEYQPKES